MGSWVTYGLGSEAEDLPGFVVMSSGTGISGGAANWSGGFLPTAYQGVVFRSQGDPILNVVYDKNVKFNFYVFGQFNLDYAGPASDRDTEIVKRLISGWGATTTNWSLPCFSTVVLVKQ